MDKPPSLKKILANDATACISAFIPPVLLALYFYVCIADESLRSEWILVVLFGAIAMASWVVAFWRVTRLSAILNYGREAYGGIGHVSFHRGRGQVVFIYTYMGQNYVGSTTVMGNKQTRSLSVGQEMVILVDGENPKRALIRDLYC